MTKEAAIAQRAPHSPVCLFPLPFMGNRRRGGNVLLFKHRMFELERLCVPSQHGCEEVR